MSRVLAVALAAALVVGACSTTPAATPSPEKKLTIACIVKDASATFFAGMIEGCKAAAEEFGVDLVISSGRADLDIEGAIRAFEDQITAAPDGIVIAPSDSVAMVPTLEKANAAGIPVAALDTSFAGGEVVTFAASDSVAGAAAAAKYLAEAIGAKGKVAALTCPVSISTCRDLLQGFESEMAKYPEITIVGTPNATPSRELGFNAVRDLLIAHPDLAGFFAFSGQDGLGGIEAAQQEGKQIVGVSRNCTVEELESILADGLSACLAQFPKQMAYLGIKALVDQRAGKDVAAVQDSGLDIVAKDRAQAYIDIGEFNGPLN